MVPSGTLEQSFGFPAQLNSSLQFQRLCVRKSMDPIIRRSSDALSPKPRSSGVRARELTLGALARELDKTGGMGVEVGGLRGARLRVRFLERGDPTRSVGVHGARAGVRHGKAASRGGNQRLVDLEVGPEFASITFANRHVACGRSSVASCVAAKSLWAADP